MNKIMLFLFLLAMNLTSETAFAHSSKLNISKPSVDLMLKTYNISYEIKGSHLSVLVNTSKAYDNLDELISIEAVNPSLPKQWLHKHVITFSDVLAADSFCFIFPYIYKTHPNINYLNVDVSYIHNDLLGNEKEDPLLSFSMTKNLEEKINWGKFKPTNDALVFPNFKFIVIDHNFH